jgi:hypothetical protein
MISVELYRPDELNLYATNNTNYFSAFSRISNEAEEDEEEKYGTYII